MELPVASLVGFLLALARTTAWMAVAPPFNSRMVPTRVKLGAAAGIALTLAPHFPADQVSLDTGTLIGLILLQVVTGLALGFLTQIIFAAVQTAGSLIDLFGGFTLSQAMDPYSNNQSSMFGRFYQLMGITVLFMINGHLLLIKGFMTSFEAVPMGGVSMDKLQKALFDHIATFGVAAVEIAGPLLAAYFLAEIALGLLSKAAPQLNILTFGFPFKILLTLLMVSAAIPLLPGAISTLVDHILRNGMGLLRTANPAAA